MNIKKIITSIVSFIKRLFGQIPAELKSAVTVGVTIAENLKKFIDSPVADALTAIIPTHIDDDLKQWLREKLPEILTALKLIDKTTKEEEIITKTAAAIAAQTDEMQNTTWHNIALLSARAASGYQLAWTDSIYLTEWYYRTYLKKQMA